MADRRGDLEDDSRAKRQKFSNAGMSSSNSDPARNPYLAHRYDESNGYQNGDGVSLSQRGSSLKKSQQHQTTSKQAREAEDGPNNPFTGENLSKQYFNILHKRRDLPVHAQR